MTAMVGMTRMIETTGMVRDGDDEDDKDDEDDGGARDDEDAGDDRDESDDRHNGYDGDGGDHRNVGNEKIEMLLDIRAASGKACLQMKIVKTLTRAFELGTQISNPHSGVKVNFKSRTLILISNTTCLDSLRVSQSPLSSW